MPPTVYATYISQIQPMATTVPSSMLKHSHSPTLHMLYQATTNHNSERYEIKLSWKSEINLENNFYSALNQVKNLNTRLQRKLLLQEKYNKTLLTDFEKNYVKPVEMQDPQPDRIWYLPQHPVENINKPGKVRQVANAASKFCDQSLNSNLLTGPDLLNNLLGVLMRFRECPVAVLADIENMFMQFAIHQIDQSALRFDQSCSGKQTIGYNSTKLPDSSLEQITCLRAQYTFLTTVPERTVNSSQKPSSCQNALLLE